MGVKPLAVATALVCGLATAPDGRAEDFRVPAGLLGQVATAIGVQARATVVIREPRLLSRRSSGVRGRFSLKEALRRALTGTGARAIFHDRSTVLIVAAAPAKRPGAISRPAPATASIATAPPVEIVVTASKQNLPLDRYPGSVKVVEPEERWFARHAAGGTAAIRKLLPTLGSTNLGPGRNKLFIRGISDSSFSGPTQATTGQYLGDVRLNYNAPDPDLNLYDMKRVEVLVGPQGALYGAGSLGGVVRLVPNAPKSDAVSASTAANFAKTRHGGFSADGAAMLNLPVVNDKLALRLVLSAGPTGGYIDAPAFGRRDINRAFSQGQRLAVRADDVGGWALDLGGVLQNIAIEDGQYTLRGDPPLVRNTAIRQPFRSNYRLGYFSAARDLGPVRLTSTTSLARHRLHSVFDATGIDGTDLPGRYVEDSDISLLAHETRISAGSVRDSWVAGFGALLNVNKGSVTLDQPNLGPTGGGVRNRQAEVAAFAQASRAIDRNLTGTFGGRLTFSGSSRKLIGGPVEGFVDPSRTTLRFAGVVALDWHPQGPLSAFYRYQQGYRAGGLGIGLTDGGLQVSRFDPDKLAMHEIGIRLGDKAEDRLRLRAAIFAADWRDIQADVIGDFGQRQTTNIGRGVIYGLDGEVVWRATSRLTLSLSAFLNDSDLREPGDADAGRPAGGSLPNVAGSGTRTALTWSARLSDDVQMTSGAAVRHVGQSRLGTGPGLDARQGGYATIELGSGIHVGRFTVSLDIENLGDVRSNTFAYGNPFGLLQGRQMTPLRPRTVTFGIGSRF